MSSLTDGDKKAVMDAWSQTPGGGERVEQMSSFLGEAFANQPALQLIYDTAPIGLAFLSPDCPVTGGSIGA